MTGEQMSGGFMGFALFVAGMLSCFVLLKALIPMWAKTAIEKERQKKRVVEDIGPDIRVSIFARLESYSLKADGAIAEVTFKDSMNTTSNIFIKVPNEVIGKFPAGTPLRLVMEVAK